MTVWVAVDLGASSTCVAVAVDQQEPRVVLVDGNPLMSSAVFADGRGIFVGAEAERQATIDPARYEPHPKRRIDEGALLLGDTVLEVSQAFAAALGRAVGEARAVLGGAAVDQLVLTHPAAWGNVRTGVLRAASTGLAANTVLVPEPVAAAVLHSDSARVGAVLAVLDLGGGTTDVSVLRREEHGFRVLATRGDPGFGGADVDQLLLEHLGAGLVGRHRQSWDAVVVGRALPDRRRRRVLTADVRGAKETLSRHAYVDVALPGDLPDAHVSRDELERLIGPRVQAAAELLAGVLADAGALDARGHSTAGVFLVGGSSRIPLVPRLVHQRLGVLAVSTDQPETVVARGALLAVRRSATPPPHPPTEPAAQTRRRSALLAAAVLAAVGVAVVATWLLVRGDEPGTTTVRAQHASMAAPTGWRQAERSEAGTTARLVLTPAGGIDESQRLLLVQTRLNEGAGVADVASTLAARVAQAQQVSPRYDSFSAGAQYAGRAVLRYREQPRPGSVVDWFVVVDGSFQLSVGCQHPQDDPESDATRARCERAVASVAASGG